MAKYQQIQVKMYDDLEYNTWTANVRFVWMVLLTNPNASLCGIQENNVQSLTRYTGLQPSEVEEALRFLVEKRKIVISKFSQEIAIVKWIPHNVTASPKQKAAVKKQLLAVKDKLLLQHLEGVQDYLPSVKQSSLPQLQHNPNRKLPDEYSTFERLKLQQVTLAALAQHRATATLH